jgi:AcrR family transcriptional regulator
MPYTPDHKAETRERILRSARRLFNRRGFAEVTLAEVMAAAGLTTGGFYHHFANKEELYAEAIKQFGRNDPPEPWRTLSLDPAIEGNRLALRIVNAYLSREHFDDREGSCPMVGMPSDVARSGDGVKSAFKQILEMMIGRFAANLKPAAEPPRDRAMALVALCVGGMVLARGVDDDLLSDQLREAARKQLLAISGWSDPRSDETGSSPSEPK